MSAEETGIAREALDLLVEALETHWQAVGARTGENDPAVTAAYRAVRMAAAAYDNALYVEHDEVTPFEFPDAVSDDDDEE